MQEQPASSAMHDRTGTPAVPRVDAFPKSDEDWRAFATLPAAERSAVYLRSIRAMLLFFTVITVLSAAAALVLMVIAFNTTGQSGATAGNPFG